MNDIAANDAGFSLTTTPSFQKVILEDNDVHLWTAELKTCAELGSSKVSFLDSSELDRAGKFKSDILRDEYIAAHVVQRSVLASYSDEYPGKILLEKGVSGKPVMRQSSGHQLRHFNMSYSRGFVLVTVSKEFEVGVDVEFLDKDYFKGSNSERLLSPSENMYIDSLPEERKTRALFTLWTAKEALSKGLGQGLSLPFEKIEIEFMSSNTGRISSLGLPLIDGLEEWTVISLDVGEDYSGAVAVKGKCGRLKTIEFNGV